MSENTDVASLAGLASYKGTVSREAPDAKTRNVSSKATSQGGFDGFLKTFLGKDKSSGTGRNGSNSRLGHNESLASSLERKPSSKKGQKSSGGSGMKMDPSQKKALRRSLDKTVPADAGQAADAAADEAPHDQLPPEVLEAAQEAARLIWDLLYGIGGAGGGLADGLAEGGADALRGLAGIINVWNGEGGNGALSGMGVAGLDMDALQQAIETANASAEMNGAAVLSALDDLLDGMPRDALADALAKTAGDMGMDASGDLFNQIAAALDAEIVAIDSGNEQNLLAMLGASGGLTPEEDVSEDVAGELSRTEAGETDASPDSPGVDPQNNTPLTAESAGIGTTESEIYELFQQFLAEKNTENTEKSPINETGADLPESGEEMLNSFVAWLNENAKAQNNKELTGDLSKLAQALLRAAGAESGASSTSGGPVGEVFSKAIGNLENLLLSNASIGAATGVTESAKTLAQSITGDTDAGQGMPMTGQGVPVAANAAGQTAPATQAQTSATMSGMMDQIENIERLAEAMRMANRGGAKNLTLQLSPPELGKVMLRVEARDGVVSAYLRVEKPEAAAQLANNLSQLRENLKAQGIELGELDIQQRGQNETLGDFSGQRRNRDAEGDYAHGRSPRGGADGGTGGEEAQAVEAAQTLRDSNGDLNFFA